VRVQPRRPPESPPTSRPRPQEPAPENGASAAAPQMIKRVFSNQQCFQRYTGFE
jgi:hypothetical protein